ncbi:Ycf51 family protein [Synechocystis sp. LKSZ1]|uniref:Ycf51 family protein n=1 Tax=Synechocystis sp. LKSZ1 TaxID=3144951 RepID=UPI00336BB8D9
MDFATYTQWSLYGTLLALILMLLALILKWGIRFRLVGITGFMAVLTIGLWGLSLGLFERAEVPGSVKFSRVYDNGANQIVISVPTSVTPQTLEATLLQAANTYFSYGRGAKGGDNQLTIRARALIHPQPGLSKPLYLGQLQRPLGSQDDSQTKVEINKKAFAQLPKVS